LAFCCDIPGFSIAKFQFFISIYKIPQLHIGSWELFLNVACAHINPEISQNNIHQFENFGDTWYVLLNSALLILTWN